MYKNRRYSSKIMTCSSLKARIPAKSILVGCPMSPLSLRIPKARYVLEADQDDVPVLLLIRDNN